MKLQLLVLLGAVLACALLSAEALDDPQVELSPSEDGR